ncbi:hypothetical protein An14g00600 [Aspergillus niger]|uniref:Uncharacterized protein n=2 Tax=Aspergillus niger TaxID=5061 RepID=A2R2F9_ASPNC|nr:hypothetical protein An14g00600 [Aspergillus niger]CAK41859.1 hypothetical protein An14g00600 [Aspergillus niger]
MGSHGASSYRNGSRTGGSSSSTNSDVSERSKSTAPTIYSDRPTPLHRGGIDMDIYDEEDPKASVSTYASTVPSEDDPPETPRYEVIDRQLDVFSTDVVPSDPSTFGQLFPSSRRLLIRHDDATLDGNMNLRVDTMVPQRGGYQQDVTLFHLRMYDLFTRKCSFRRYCRDSGREVCHSERRPVASSSDRHPVFRRSWGSVLASLRPGSSGHGSLPSHEHKRQDSGYRSAEDDDESFEDKPSDHRGGWDRHFVLTDSTLLEFSNYAHVELRRRGAGLSKRYEFEYWSTRYQWRRECRKEGELREVSYHLVNTRTSKTVAHIVPEILTPMEAAEEEKKGGWVPPSSMWISDPSVYEKMPDVAELGFGKGGFALNFGWSMCSKFFLSTSSWYLRSWKGSGGGTFGRLPEGQTGMIGDDVLQEPEGRAVLSSTRQASGWCEPELAACFSLTFPSLCWHLPGTILNYDQH